MIKIYHNPRCKKSREGLAIIENSKQPFEIVKYLENPLSKEELKEILLLLNMSPSELVRKNEKIWKEKYKGKDLSENEIISAFIENPKLIERPIIVKNSRAVIGRPPENISTIL